MDSVTRKHLVLENTRCCHFTACRGCGKIHLHFGPSTITMRPDQFQEVLRQLQVLADQVKDAPLLEAVSDATSVVLNSGHYVVA